MTPFILAAGFGLMRWGFDENACRYAMPPKKVLQQAVRDAVGSMPPAQLPKLTICLAGAAHDEDSGTCESCAHGHNTHSQTAVVRFDCLHMATRTMVSCGLRGMVGNPDGTLTVRPGDRR